ncbi:DUF6891 domain-containing protein [Polyangium mundeleinium]|uniref:DUF6891 domain-containing protein n=1 Tax=Polyangium mundeleinium TaxID=2995306 RepID=A0ABT5F5F0_9BACT|nr:hypothetical protein [Polyangium mundeleinium]MDC0749318.1 hypothetical protein [Polyangium mundeleinium]
MLRDESNPYSAAVFLKSWALEIRAGYTPAAALDVTERLNEYLDPDVPPNVEACLLAEVTRETEQLLREAHEAEASWAGPTMNDRITAAFDELRTRGILAKECAGLTIQDGWGYACAEAEPSYEGAVFFHQQDVFDALHGMSLLLAFGGVQEQPEAPAQARAIALSALESLAAHGVPASWTGRIEDRIEILPFEWQRRRWTTAPREMSGAATWQRSTRQLGLFSVSTADLERFVAPVRAYRTTFGFDAMLSAIMRGVWKSLGGERGQVGHAGDPHVLVPAGEVTTMMPRDAFANLDPTEAAAIRRRAMAARRPVAGPRKSGDATMTVPTDTAGAAPEQARSRPWWKLW